MAWPTARETACVRHLRLQHPAAVMNGRDAGSVHVATYVMGSGEEQRPPAHTVRGGSEAQVEPEARAWIDAHFPREEQEPL